MLNLIWCFAMIGITLKTPITNSVDDDRFLETAGLYFGLTQYVYVVLRFLHVKIKSGIRMLKSFRWWNYSICCSIVMALKTLKVWVLSQFTVYKLREHWWDFLMMLRIQKFTMSIWFYVCWASSQMECGVALEFLHFLYLHFRQCVDWENMWFIWLWQTFWNYSANCDRTTSAGFFVWRPLNVLLLEAIAHLSQFTDAHLVIVYL